MKTTSKKKCEHGRQQYQCRLCKGAGICVHDKQRRHCAKCGGGCEHGFANKGQCKRCGGKQICEHNSLRTQCVKCGGYPTLARKLCSNIKYQARLQKVPFNLTPEHVLELIGDGVCPVLGILYDSTTGRRMNDTSASIDKFDPKLGYIIGNCAVISLLANRIKTNATTEQVCRVAEWMKSH